MSRTLTIATLLASLTTACKHGHGSPHAGAPGAPVKEIGIAIPIAPGKTEAWRTAIQELTGPRYAEYEASRRRFGLTSQTTFLQRTPMGDFAVIHMTGPDVHASFHAMSESRDEWDARWRELTLDLHGMDFAKGERVLPKVQFLFSTGDATTPRARPFMFIAPLGSGGSERLRAMAAEIMGPRRREYEEARAAIGVRREAAFLESTGMGDAVVFYWLTDDPVASLARFAASSQPFDVWVRSAAAKVHPIPLEQIVTIASSNALIGAYPHPRD